MLLTSLELTALLDRKISLIQLAYLVRVGAVSRPLQIPRGKESFDYLFDEDHVRQIQGTLGVTAASINAADLQPAYSDGARTLLAQRPLEEVGNIGEDIPSVDLDDLHRPRPPLLRRMWRWVTTFGCRPQLTGHERARLGAIGAIVSTQTPGWLVCVVAPRLRRFGTATDEKCLIEYIARFEKIGWGMFGEELDLAEALLAIDRELRDAPPVAGLARIAALEREYEILCNETRAYLEKHDPDGLIAKQVIHVNSYDSVSRIILGAQLRGKRELQTQLPGRNEVKGMIEKAVLQIGRAAV